VSDYKDPTHEDWLEKHRPVMWALCAVTRKRRTSRLNEVKQDAIIKQELNNDAV